MRIQLLLLFFSFVFCGFSATDLIAETRNEYRKYAVDKELCKKKLELLSKVKNNSPTHLGYFGSLQTFWAKHVFSPISKLKTFKIGRNNIEQAISKQPQNIELRFIRLSVQKNAPSFLGYDSNIEEDQTFITKNLDKVSSTVLRKNIENLLKTKP